MAEQPVAPRRRVAVRRPVTEQPVAVRRPVTEQRVAVSRPRVRSVEGGELKLPSGDCKLWLLLAQPDDECRRVELARPAEHQARNLPTLSHPVHGVLRQAEKFCDLIDT